jgi:Josephin
MYTKLPQDRILRNVEKAIKEAHDYQLAHYTPTSKELYMFTSTKLRGQWTHIHHPNTLSVQEMIEHVHFIVKNTYFMSADGTIRHQKFGIPMGTNAGPEIANLCLYVDEAKYVDDLHAAGNTREAQLHANTSRFIDDVLSWDTLPPPPSIYGLEWKETTNNDGSCNFLGVKIHKWSNGMIRLSVFDKAAEWNFHVIRYPSKLSNIPIHQPAGILTGQVTRFWNICNNLSDFKHAVTQLTLRLLLRGHPPSTLMKGWNKYVRRHHRRSTSLSVKVTHWFRRMVQWALHHPLPDPSMHTQSTPATTNTIDAHNAQSIPETAMPPCDNPTRSPTNVTAPDHTSTNTCTPRTRNPRTCNPRTRNPKRRSTAQDTDYSPPGTKHTKRPRHASPANVCGLHALNACLQAYSLHPFTFASLNTLAQTIDAQEAAAFQHDPRELRIFRRENGTNRNSSGFTLQTLLHALHKRNLQYTQHSSPVFTQLPASCLALLLHTPQPEPLGHFVALVKKHNSWHLFDNDACTRTFASNFHALQFLHTWPTVIIIFQNTRASE